jgi:hypothetical protein
MPSGGKTTKKPKRARKPKAPASKAKTPALLATLDDDLSGSVAVPFLGGEECEFLIEEDPNDPDVRAAVENTLRAKPSILTDAERYVVQCCEDTLASYPAKHRPTVTLRKPGDVWSHVRFGSEFQVSRRADGDSEDGVYVSLECNCDWDREHGLQLVLRDGRAITKVGPFDGHVTNSDAYDDPSLAGVVYKRIGGKG